MQYKKTMFIGLMMAIPFGAQAQEAFISQVGTFNVSVTAPVALNTAALMPTFTTVRPDTATVEAAFVGFDMPSTSGGAFADVQQTGNNNSASIRQDGINAALIVQNANNASASVYQTGGSGNRAAVYQMASNASASVFQRGSNNTAMVIQN